MNLSDSRSLSVFNGIFGDSIGASYLDLVAALDRGDGAVSVAGFRKLSVALAVRVESGSKPVVGDAWQDWLVDRLLADVNPLSRVLESTPLAALGQSLLDYALEDLEIIRALVDSGASLLRQETEAVADGRGPKLGSGWGDVRAAAGADPDPETTELKRRLLTAAPSAALELLAAHYRRGVGMFGAYRAFRWTAHGLIGIEHPDVIRLASLVGYDSEREPVIANTRQFVAGLPANDVLLYGARGTGKSSTVKAMLNEFGHLGLRLVEVAKERLGELGAIHDALGDRPERFVLYVDDLSFEDDETEYKALKALLEGTLAARPSNVIIYATSNRRNLITERWGERAPGDDDVNPRERLEEKLSLADRFGIRVAFPSPDQERYLEIVLSLALEAGIKMSESDLRQRAIRWELLHSGRSGRIARQLVIALLGEAVSHSG